MLEGRQGQSKESCECRGLWRHRRDGVVCLHREDICRDDGLGLREGCGQTWMDRMAVPWP